MRVNGQLDLFSDYAARVPASAVDPAEVWRKQRKQQLEELSRKFGVPLHEEVEVWLTQGLRLCGLIQLADEDFWADAERDQVELRIGKATFRLGEIESLVRV